MNPLHQTFAQFPQGCQLGQICSTQSNICCFTGNIRGIAHCNGNICRCECWCIVDTVTNHHCAAVHGEPDAILRRNGILQNFLRAVGMDEDCHRAGVALETGGLHLGDVWLRFGLNLATIGLGGDLRLAGAARGIVGTADASKQPASLHRSWATLTALGEFAHSSSVTIK